MGNEIEPTPTEYAAAYWRTGLRKTGQTLQTALQNPMFKKCLTRIAIAQRAKQAQEARQLWFNKF